MLNQEIERNISEPSPGNDGFDFSVLKCEERGEMSVSIVSKTY